MGSRVVGEDVHELVTPNTVQLQKWLYDQQASGESASHPSDFFLEDYDRNSGPYQHMQERGKDKTCINAGLQVSQQTASSDETGRQRRTQASVTIV